MFPLPAATLGLLIAIVSSCAGAVPQPDRIIRIAVLPTACMELDRQIVETACRIGGLTPEVTAFPSFSEARQAFSLGTTDAIAGISYDQALLTGGRFLPSYRKTRLSAAVLPDSAIQTANDFMSCTCIVLADGHAGLYAQTNGWHSLFLNSPDEAERKLLQGGTVAFLHDANAFRVAKRFRLIDLGRESPISVVVPLGSRHLAALESGLRSVEKTGFAAMARSRLPSPPAAGFEVNLVLLTGAGMVLCAAALVLLQDSALRAKPALLNRQSR